MKLRVGKALIGALNKADLFNHSQFRVYKIAKLLGISQSALYRNKNMIKRRLKQI
jgi:predicted transcriptional regulator